jgi:hypothetical protein
MRRVEGLDFQMFVAMDEKQMETDAKYEDRQG